MYHERRKGISTIMGTLIFVGILFTSVIPMYLVMKQADNIYTQNVHKMEISDQDRSREVIEAIAYPPSQTSPDLYIKVTNTGALPVEIMRVWINDDSYSRYAQVASQNSQVLEKITITPLEGKTYTVTVTTKRGNSFASTSDTLYYHGGEWYTPSLGIHIIVLNTSGKYKIWVYSSTPRWNMDAPIQMAHDTGTSSLDHGDIECTQLVPTPGEYTVVVQKKVGSSYIDLPGTPVTVEIVWPAGSPVITVVADGRGT
jgi:archaellum component FlaF (FlaF/FlaG flagellin family)